MSKENIKKIYYICHSASQNKRSDLKIVPSVIPIVDYVSDSATSLGYSVEIVSALTTNKKRQDFEQERERDILYTYLPSRNLKTRLGRHIMFKIFHVELLIYLLKNVKKNDMLLVYHSMSFINLIYIFAFFKRAKIVLQIEEYYSYVNMKCNTNWRRKELKFIKRFKNYICVNDIIASELETSSTCVLYGPYRMSKICRKTKRDDIIRVIYAGGITKLGVSIAISKTASYLPDNYRIIIIGYGPQDDITELNGEIQAQNAYAGFEKVSYKGFFEGNEYDKILASCDIGISLYKSPDGQDEDATKYMFSSKIMSYLSHGLYVVASDTQSLIESRLIDVVEPVSSFCPEDIARAVMRINVNEGKNVSDTMQEMDTEFRDKFKQVLLN